MSHNNANEEVLNLIRIKDADGLRSKLLQMGFSLLPKAFANSKGALSYIKGFNLQTILGVGPTLRCIFHKDANPSASVYQADSGDWLYKCHSGACSGEAMNVLGLVEKLQGSKNAEALSFLLWAFNVSVQSSTANFFTAYLKALSERFAILAPTAFSLIDVNVLTGIYLWAEHCFKGVNCDGWTSVTFSCSNQQLADRCQRKNLKASPWLALFTFLGLLRRIPAYELGEKRYDDLLNHRNAEQVGKWTKPINCIRLFLLTDAKLAEIEANAIRWKAMDYTFSSFTYSAVYDKEGSFRAHELFPSGDMDWAFRYESPSRKLRKATEEILGRELAAHGEIRLNALKDLLVKETGLSKKRIQLSLKPILDILCQTDYCRVKESRLTVIKRRAFPENPAA
jgi:hypothetical protein